MPDATDDATGNLDAAPSKAKVKMQPGQLTLAVRPKSAPIEESAPVSDAVDIEPTAVILGPFAIFQN
jgi:hypothetical protein